MDVVTESLGRFKKITSNQMMGPGKCAGCGKFSNDDFLDFGLEVDFYGVVYFCRECLTEAAMVFGFRPDIHYNKLSEQLNRTRIELIGSMEREEALRNALASLTANYDWPGISTVSLASVEPDEQPGQVNDSVDAGEQRSDEQSNEQGSTGLQHDDSLDEFLGISELDI